MAKITIKENSEKESKVKVGQFYRRKDDGGLFIVAYLYDGYSLIELGDGIAWGEISDDLETLIDFDEFELLENCKVTIEV